MKCSVCLRSKSPNSFHLDRRNPRGRQYACKACRSSNLEHARAAVTRVQIWRENNPVGEMLRRARRRAKEEGAPFSLTAEDIHIPEYCPILGIKLQRAKGRVKDNSPSLDKIIPTKGYIPGNVQVISSKANVMKNNATPRELRLFAVWVRRTYGD
jgi:hypothetical protein